MATAISLADALVDFVNAGFYDESFTATREMWPQKAVETSGLNVAVYVGPRGGAITTRSSYRHEYSVFLVVTEKLSGTEATQKTRAAALSTLVEEIEQSIENERIDGLEMIEYSEDVDRQPYNIEQLREVGTFVSAVGFSFTD